MKFQGEWADFTTWRDRIWEAWRIARMHAIVFLAHRDAVLLNAAVRIDPGEMVWDRLVPKTPPGVIVVNNLIDGHPAHEHFYRYAEAWRPYWDTHPSDHVVRRNWWKHKPDEWKEPKP